MKIIRAGLAIAVASAVFSLSAKSFMGLSYSTSKAKQGAWTSKLSSAKKLAEKKGVPLVAMWVSKDCGHCQGLAQLMAYTPSFSAWCKESGYVFVIGVEKQDVYNFADDWTLQYYPLCAVYLKSGSKVYVYKHFDGPDSPDEFMSQVKNALKVSVKVKKSGKGTVSGAGKYVIGSSKTLKAKASKGYEFAGWYNSSGKTRLSKKTSYKITVPKKSTTYLAKFKKVKKTSTKK